MMMLSPREAEIARLIGEDLTDKEIANITRLSVNTVRTYVGRVAEKLNITGEQLSRRRIIRRWIERQETM